MAAIGQERGASPCYNINIVDLELAAALRIKPGVERTAALVSWFQGLFPPQFSVPVLVGGAAVELYTGGAYTTGDLDFVGDIPRPVADKLVGAGFRREGRHWILEPGEVFIELPGTSLESDEPAVQIDVGGISVIAASPESMLVDRLSSWQFWRSSVDGVNAYLLWIAQEKRMDHNRIVALAKKRGVEKSLERLASFTAEFRGRSPADRDLERWAETFP